MAAGFHQSAYWENQGGRKEAAIDKRKREREAADKAASDKAKRTALWLKLAAMRRWATPRILTGGSGQQGRGVRSGRSRRGGVGRGKRTG